MKKPLLIVGLVAAVFALGLGVQDAAAHGWVSGVVLDRDGAPVAGAQVMIAGMRHQRGQRPFHAETATNDDGAFGFRDVPAGRYQIGAHAEGAGAARVGIAVEDGAGTNVRLMLRGRRGGGGEERGVGAVIATVTDQDGNPIEGAQVVLMAQQRHRGGRHFRGARAETNGDGQAVFDEVPEGNYVVGARARGYRPDRERLEVVADQRNFVELQLQGRR